MILDTLNNAGLYHGLGERFCAGFDYLAATDFTSLEDGRYAIDGDNLFAMVQRYDTKSRERGVWEAHRCFVDIQYMAAGTEIIGYANLVGLTPTQDYSKDKDILFLAGKGKGDFLTVDIGGFAVFFPEDAHMPGLASGPVATPVLKVVVKVRVRE